MVLKSMSFVQYPCVLFTRVYVSRFVQRARCDAEYIVGMHTKITQGVVTAMR